MHYSSTEHSLVEELIANIMIVLEKRFRSYSLTKSWLLLPILIISFVLHGCKSEGDNPTGADIDEPDTEEPAEISSSFVNSNTTFLPGEIQLIEVKGIEINADTYSAELENGQEVILYHNIEDTERETLIFLVPEEAPGNQLMVFEIEGQEQSLEFDIADYEVIENPEEFVSNKKNEISDRLTALVAEVSDEDIKATLNSAISDLEEAIIGLSSLEESEQKQIAYIIRENIRLDQLSKNKDISGFDSCTTVESRLNNSPKEVFKAATTGVTGNFLSGLKGAILNTFGTARVFNVLSQTIDDIDYFISNCIVPELSIESMNKAKQTYIFEHDESRNFSVSSSKSLNDELLAIIGEIQNYLGSLLSLLPDSWKEYLFENDFITFEPVDADLLTLIISETEISGEMTSDNGTVSLTFAFNEEANPSESKEFIFSITSESDNILEVEARLNPPLPTAFDLEFTIDVDETLSESLDADFVGSFSIEDHPANGEISLIDETSGTFEYIPNEGFEGEDNFTYIASNNVGSSEKATVSITVSGESYELQIGDYNPDYTLIEPQRTIMPGGDLVVANNMDYMVRLTRDGVPVNVGPYNLEWTKYTFGSPPVSSQDIVINDYEIEIYDATNGKNVSIKLNELTLTNAAYEAIVGKTVKAIPYNYGEPGNIYRVISFNSDGTYSYEFQDGSGSTTSTYDFVALITPSNINCSTYTITKNIIGAVGINVSLPGSILKYILIYDDGTLGANSFYGCTEDPDRYSSTKIEYN